MSVRGNREELRLIQGGRSEVAAEINAELEVPYSRFVQCVFQDILGRTPTLSAATDWVAQLCSGASAMTLATCLLHSQENRERQIEQNYLKLLGRTPNADGLSFWTNLLTSGKKQEEVLAAMVSSSEYFTKNGSTNDGYIRALYIDLIGRRASEAEVDSWVGLLNSESATRLAIAYDFLSGEEYRLNLINEWFWRFLRRQADPQGTRHWLDQMKSGKTQEFIQASLISTKEYFGSSLTRT